VRVTRDAASGEGASGSLRAKPQREPDPSRELGRRAVITPSMFGIPFGIVGLSGTWRVVGQHGASVIADALAVVSAVLAVWLSLPWLIELVRGERRLSADLANPVAGPFVPVFAITPMVLSTRLLTLSEGLGRTLVALFALLTIVAGLAVVAAWLIVRLPLESYHPGFYLPTAGGTLLAAQCVTSLGWTELARALFFVGLSSWLVLGVVTSVRLVRTPVAPALRPAVVIELAAPALATSTYLVVFGRYDGYAVALTAVTAVMAVVQLALIPYYRGAPFGVAYWAAAFSYAITATTALRWIDHEHPPHAGVWSGLTLAFATGVVVLLSFATVHAALSGRFLAKDAPLGRPGSH
jgi:tellurite resistance protein